MWTERTIVFLPISLAAAVSTAKKTATPNPRAPRYRYTLRNLSINYWPFSWLPHTGSCWADDVLGELGGTDGVASHVSDFVIECSE